MIAKIKAIDYYLPKRILTNEELAKEHPDWDMSLVEEKVGVLKRHIAGKDETALSLSFWACMKLFSKRQEAKNQIDAIIFCTESPDYILPPNACILHKMLHLREDVLAFDINLGCSGYIYGLALAQALIYSGQASNILLVNADTYSKYINRDDRSTRVLFGDGAAVSWIARDDLSMGGILDIKCCTMGEGYDRFIIKSGKIEMDGMAILNFVSKKVPEQIRHLLAVNELTVDDIDLFVFHQASKLVLDRLTRLLKIDPKKTYSNLDRVGNTVSASIPIALKDAMDEGKLSQGDKVLLSGFGLGLSWGSAVVVY